MTYIMKPKALINLPQWIPVVWLAATLSIGSLVVELVMEKEWGTYLSVFGTFAEIILWDAIIRSLRKKENCKTSLIVMLAISFSLQLVSSIFSAGEVLSFISLVSWLIAMIIIIKNYSGALQNYAIAELVCLGLLLIGLIVFAVVVAIQDSSNLQTSLRLTMCILIFLLCYPYKMLAEALKENDAEEKKNEVEEKIEE